MNDKKTEHADGAQGEREDWSAFDNGVDWSCFPGYLIDHCEGCTVSEEFLQFALSDMLKDEDYLRIQSEKSRAALAQPSPAESALRDAMAYGTGIISNGEHVPLAEALQPSPAPELERPDFGAWWTSYPLEDLVDYNSPLDRMNAELVWKACTAQHDRIVGALRAAHQLTLDELHAMEVHVAQAGRDIEAAQARVAELEKQEPVAWFTDFPGNRVYAAKPHGFDELGCHLSGDSVSEHWRTLYAAPVAQAGKVPDRAEFLAWAEKVLNDEQERLLAEDYLMDSDDCIKALHEAAAQAQGE